jgi:uncharacterized protein
MSEQERQLSPEEIDRFRQLGLRLDREGRWWHEGQPVQHRGLALALSRWLDRLPDGRFIVRLDAERFAYVEVEDAPFVVTTVLLDRGADGVHVTAQLNDDSAEELDYDTLRVGADNALYCEVKQRRFSARFSRAAYYLLGELIEEADGSFSLRAAGGLWPLR